eukprot:1591942-Rhodomonas_salina.3
MRCYCTTRSLRDAQYEHIAHAHAICGTRMPTRETVYSATCLRACYAMSGTDVATAVTNAPRDNAEMMLKSIGRW